MRDLQRRLISGVNQPLAIVSVLVLALAITGISSGATTSASEVPVSIEDLSGNTRLNDPETILQDFRDGKPSTRIIINLSKTASAEDLPDPGTPGWLESLHREVSRAQGKVLERLDPDQVKITNRFNYVYGFAAEVTLPGLQSLLNQPEVFSIEPNRILVAHTAQGVELINASTVRSTHAGSGMAIAICDTGIDYTHPQLGNGGFPNSKVIGGWDCGDDDSNPMDGNGHGTSCAGIAAGDVYLEEGLDYVGGVAHEARLYAVKISFGTSGEAYYPDMVEGWEWCVEHQNDDPNHPIMIISTSFGSGGYSSTCDGAGVAMTAAAALAVEAGITIFSSSGNEGYCDSIGWPACISDVISVGAVYDADFGRNPPDPYVFCISKESCVASGKPPNPCVPDKYAFDSTTGTDLVPVYSNTAVILDVLAPSNWATTTVLGGGFDTEANGFGGTSASCPYAAGAAACLQTAAFDLAGRYLTPDEVRYYMVNTGSPVTDAKVAITKPRIDLQAAVDAMIEDLVPDEYMVEIQVSLQGTGRPEPEGWEVPLNIGFYTAMSGTSTLLNPGSAQYYFPDMTGTYTITAGGTRSVVLVGPVNPGTYDITVDNSTTLLNVKRAVSIP